MRHNPIYTRQEKNTPLSAGNGAFCFTADYTGLQALYDGYAAAMIAASSGFAYGGETGGSFPKGFTVEAEGIRAYI
jgi:hypothetical protein